MQIAQPQSKFRKEPTFKGAFDFIDKTKEALKTERHEEIEQFKTLISTNTTKQLEAMGLMFNNLQLKSTKSGLYGRTLITLAHPLFSKAAVDSQKDTSGLKLPDSKFGAGDNVSIYDQEDFLRNKPLLEGIVHKKGQYKITISIDIRDEESEVDIEGRTVCVCCSINQVTYNRYEKVLQDLSAIAQDHTHHSNRIINTLFNQKEYPILNDPIESIKKHLPSSGLNEQQVEAVRKSLGTESVHLIHGPPGTGKTKTVCEIIAMAVVEKNYKVLACAGSNIAVDNMVERVYAKWGKSIKVCRLGHPSRMVESVEDHSLDALITKTSSYKLLREEKQKYQQLKTRFLKTKEKAARKDLKKEIVAAKAEMRNHEQVAVQEVLGEANVIFCTNAGAGERIFKYELAKTVFDLVIIDECAQALEASCWIPLLKGRKAVLAGDHKQLPPTIKSKASSKLLSYTLFDRAMEQCRISSTLLTVQYRMNNSIMAWSSQNFYSNLLIADASVRDHSLLQLVTDQQQSSHIPLMLIDTAGCKMGENNTQANDFSKSKFNLGESDIVRVVLEELLQHGLKKEHIGVITPYNSQVNQIKQLLDDLELPENFVDNTVTEVSTVDGFQGREKQVIIISMVRSNPKKVVGFLSDYRRMNVAVTRAKRLVVLIGDSDTVCTDPTLKTLIQYFREHGEIRSGQDFRNSERVRFGLGYTEHEQQQPQQQKKQKTKKKEQKKDSTKNNKEPVIKQVTQAEIRQKLEGVQVDDNENTNELRDLGRLNDLETKYRTIIQNFMTGDESEFVFKRINPAERRVVHMLGDFYGLEHTTSADKMSLTIRKPKKEQEQPKSRVLTEEEMNAVDKQVASIFNNKSITKTVIAAKDPETTSYLKHICRNNNLQVQVSPDGKEITVTRPKEKKEQPQTKPKNGGAPKEKNNKKKEEEVDTQQEQLEFLDSLIQDQKRCHFKARECKAKVTYMGMRCKFCNEIFCQEHLLAELHGCGKEAHLQAHKQFVESVNKQKDLSDKDRRYLEYELSKKIRKHEEKRAGQPKKKDK